MVTDIPAGDGKIPNFFYSARTLCAGGIGSVVDLQFCGRQPCPTPPVEASGSVGVDGAAGSVGVDGAAGGGGTVGAAGGGGAAPVLGCGQPTGGWPLRLRGGQRLRTGSSQTGGGRGGSL